jgi:hypothetical protein
MPLALVLLAALCGGCGTLDNIKRPTFPPPNKPDAKVVRVYGGVRGDWVIITEYDWSRTQSYIDYAFIPLFAAIDLVLDVAGDTVTLPFTAVAELRRATRRPDAKTDDPNAPPSPFIPGTPPGTPVTNAATAPNSKAPANAAAVPPLSSTPVPASGSAAAPPLASTPVGGANR